MSTGSTKTAPDTSENCPAWCVEHEFAADGTESHWGPTFGSVGTQLLESGGVGAFLDGAVVGPAELRKHAADLLAAAEWLEALQ